MAAETEVVGQRSSYFSFARNIRNIVKVKAFFKVRIFVVNGRRNNAGINGQCMDLLELIIIL